MDIQKNSFLSIEQLANQVINAPKEEKAKKTTTADGLSFGQILSQKNLEENGLKFSKHASFRLADRGIQISADQMNRLEGGARKAAEKGIKDSLVLVDDMAFIVNIPNQTVVTAMDSTETIENVFTHINGAVIM
jgi:flagellar operon protein